jgi:acetoin utilization protein AcuB
MSLAAQTMTKKVIVAPPEMSLDHAWQLMCRMRFRHLPIVSGGRLIGILSDRDIFLRSSREDGEVVVPDTPVGEAATPSPFVCQPDTDVRDLVRLMTEQKIDAVPVIDDNSSLVGLVTSTDLLLLLVRLDEAKVPLPFVFEIEEHSAVFIS